LFFLLNCLATVAVLLRRVWLVCLFSQNTYSRGISFCAEAVLCLAPNAAHVLLYRLYFLHR